MTAHDGAHNADVVRFCLAHHGILRQGDEECDRVEPRCPTAIPCNPTPLHIDGSGISMRILSDSEKPTPSHGPSGSGEFTDPLVSDGEADA